MGNATCSFPGCGRSGRSKGLCSGHYQQQAAGQALRPIGSPKLTPAERFWAKVQKTDSCWQWVGAVGGHTYGNFWGEGKHVRAHRFSYELLRGPIPDGLHLDHLCRNRLCVNPDHLEPVEPEENTRRGVRRLLARYQRINQTHCKHGHPLSGDNLYVQPKTGYRYCKECNRRRTRVSDAKRRARIKEARNAAQSG